MKPISAITLLLLPLALIVEFPAASNAEPPWLTVFRDDFEGSTLDPNRWTVLEANGSYSLDHGFLLMRSQPSGFPSIATNPGAVPASGDLRIRIGFRYGQTTGYGTSIAAVAFGTGIETCSNSPANPPWYGFHRDYTGTSVSVYPTELYTTCGLGPWQYLEAPSNIYHVGELTFTEDGLTAIIDGAPFAASSGPFPRPNSVFFGWGDACCSYTEFDIDFVEVQVRDQPIPTRISTLGRVKAMLR